MTDNAVGSSKVFVQALGYREIPPFTALVDVEGAMRVFFRIEADPDSPRTRPRDAWRTLLAALPVGAEMRFLLSWWPEEKQRLAFVQNMDKWALPDTFPKRKQMFEALRDMAYNSPLPFARSLVLEFRLLNAQLVQWLTGIPELLAGYGLVCTPMDKEEIEKLASRVFNPEV